MNVHVNYHCSNCGKVFNYSQVGKKHFGSYPYYYRVDGRWVKYYCPECKAQAFPCYELVGKGIDVDCSSCGHRFKCFTGGYFKKK